MSLRARAVPAGEMGRKRLARVSRSEGRWRSRAARLASARRLNRSAQEEPLDSGAGENADEEDNRGRAEKRGDDDEGEIKRGDLRIKSRADTPDPAEGQHERGAEKNERPTGNRERFDEFPPENPVMGDG